LKEKNINSKFLSWKFIIVASLIIVAIIILNLLILIIIPNTLTLYALFFSLIFTFYFYVVLFLGTRMLRRGFIGLKLPSFYTISLFLLPVIFMVIILFQYGGNITAHEVITSIITSGLSINFWYIFLTVPLATYHKIRELKKMNVMVKNYPLISIIVPAFNEEKTIGATIRSLIEADYPNKEIIVVDDGSTDRTLNIALNYAKYGVRVYHKENGGKASAVNYGLRFSKGEIIIVIDADSIIGRDTLKEIIRFFTDPRVVAVAGNVKVLNRRNLITRCQALEYIIGINIFRRALDIAGAVPVIPGALGAFRREYVSVVGYYDKDTIVEDFDITVKLLKMGSVVQASSIAVAYTEAPDTLNDLYKQRMRWYRGNFQAIIKHKDALVNPRYTYLQRISMPYVLSSMLILPILSMIVWASAIYLIFMGMWMTVLILLAVFTTLQALLSLLAIEIDEEDRHLVLYSPLLVIGYKHLLDFLLLKAFFDVIVLRRRIGWTRARRIGTIK